MYEQSLLESSLVSCCAMAIMLVITLTSHSLNCRQKQYFSAIFVVIPVVILSELLTRLLNGTHPELRWLHILSNFIGFSLAPLIPVLFAGVVSDHKRSRPLFILLAVYSLILVASFPFHFIFCVDAANVYSRRPGYSLFLLVYLITVIHMVREAFLLYLQYQDSNRLVLGLLVVFLIFGTIFQTLVPFSTFTYMSWTAVSFAAILYYIYCTDLWLQVDGLTGLLSHGAYLRRLHSLDPGAILVLFDVDKFKQVNDTYGHLFGDQALIQIAKLIRTVFGGKGLCYRIGGDEFAVLVPRLAQYNVTEKEMKFRHFLRELGLALPGLPDVSVGHAVYSKGMTPEDLINLADQNMYSQKHSKV